VTGVDAIDEAIAAARRNAARLGFDNAHFIALKADENARFLAGVRYHPQIVILDPPRAGAHSLISLLVRLKPRRVIYVSCDVSTLARDLRVLAAAGYRRGRLRAFDFFPNTHHAEVVAEMLLT
jgi:23S rRNA (uracil1939-C5)-methyltransferase